MAQHNRRDLLLGYAVNKPLPTSSSTSWTGQSHVGEPNRLLIVYFYVPLSRSVLMSEDDSQGGNWYFGPHTPPWLCSLNVDVCLDFADVCKNQTPWQWARRLFLFIPCLSLVVHQAALIEPPAPKSLTSNSLISLSVSARWIAAIR
jgi:hypothetical protein